MMGDMKIRVGTSGFGYREWKNKFYPADLPASEYLKFYAGRFPTTEVNSSFYRMPTEEALESWLDDVPSGFVFAFKAPQVITHMKRLRNVEREVRTFVATVAVMGPKLGPLNFQLPPNLKADPPLLTEFLGVVRSINPAGPCAMEFRHPSWFDDKVLEILEKEKVALTFNDADVENCPLEATTDWGLVKLRRVDYQPAEVTAWAKKIASVKRWKKAFVYFKHEDTASGPKWAGLLMDSLARRSAG